MMTQEKFVLYSRKCGTSAKGDAGDRTTGSEDQQKCSHTK
jgi:hypothetical protein